MMVVKTRLQDGNIIQHVNRALLAVVSDVVEWSPMEVIVQEITVQRTNSVKASKKFRSSI